MTTMVSRSRDEKYEQLVTQYVASLPDKLAALQEQTAAAKSKKPASKAMHAPAR